jgi:hypothetical protein
MQTHTEILLNAGFNLVIGHAETQALTPVEWLFLLRVTGMGFRNYLTLCVFLCFWLQQP